MAGLVYVAERGEVDEAVALADQPHGASPT